jgi:hypothetical protein
MPDFARPPLTRRDFLKLGALALGGLALGDSPLGGPWPPDEYPPGYPRLHGRVATRFIYRYSEPNFKSDVLGRIPRDTLLGMYEMLHSSDGPAYNPRWYRLEHGYVHSGHIQPIASIAHNPVLRYIPEGGQLGEITVPYFQALRMRWNGDWDPVYRLYYQSVHWINELIEGPDGEPWYGLLDERLRIHYYLPAKYVRAVPDAELEPLSPDVPFEEKKIEVRIGEQLLVAYERDQVVLETKISSGVSDIHSSPDFSNDVEEIPTDTPKGRFRVQVKIPSKHMGDGEITDDLNAYELPGVPWVGFFYRTGVAFHGTYWHDNFGRRMSHGCVNMRNEDAKWLYRWSQPHAGAQEWLTTGLGTVVKVLD